MHFFFPPPQCLVASLFGLFFFSMTSKDGGRRGGNSACHQKNKCVRGTARRPWPITARLAAAIVARARGHRVRVDRVAVICVAIGVLCTSGQLDETPRASAKLLNVSGRRIAVGSRRVIGALSRVAATPVAAPRDRQGRVARRRIGGRR
ncbi:hypothetical protein TW95_gp1546 [Pandoravirus inopinatum]|uniref:Uncharacterized protein n=1 Tax=Pandoravirus inopinatum TaxID=1605721 RepID=A0A0B5J8M4_9VIRU|nr:hypothetical protein TW95_gp1546 [Pandoravirus inopinatum]AJF98280.1 hypothetical protein [Pandoravirus inopinatum]